MNKVDKHTGSVAEKKQGFPRHHSIIKSITGCKQNDLEECK